MKLFTFGDSWTAGVGCNLKVEDTIKDNEELGMYRNSMSWPKYLSDLLNVEFLNLGEQGSSNKEIFDKIITTIKSKIISQNDLVIIMWSSSLRDDTPFFPNGESSMWGILRTGPKWKFNWFVKNSLKNTIGDSQYNNFIKSYKEFFINNLYDDNYYNIVNQNYILFIQKLLESYNINYIFCDAFDCMINKNMSADLDKTHFINKSNYYKFGEITFRDFLISLDSNDINLWEESTKWPDAIKHPNAIGYQKISNELFDFIIKSNIIKNNKSILKIL
jgi:lysophospholipase L1-like esterase